jgi:hypothetical protein
MCDGATYTAWVVNVAAALPGVAANPPRVAVNTANNLVTIQVFWLLPSEPAGTAPHNYALAAQIN